MLDLKIGCMIICLQNLAPNHGLYNTNELRKNRTHLRGSIAWTVASTIPRIFWTSLTLSCQFESTISFAIPMTVNRLQSEWLRCWGWKCCMFFQPLSNIYMLYHFHGTSFNQITFLPQFFLVAYNKLIDFHILKLFCNKVSSCAVFFSHF